MPNARKRNLTAGHCLVCLVVLLTATPALVSAQTAADKREQDTRDKLQDVETDIANREEKRAALQQQRDALIKEIRNMQADLVTLARERDRLEAQLASLADQLLKLDQKRQETETRLAEKAADLSRSLAAMQRLSRQPTSLLLARDSSAVRTARTAMLLDYIMPTLAEKAAALRTETEALRLLQAETAAARAEQGQRLASLQQQADRANRLIARRNDRQQELNRLLGIETKAIEKLVAEARDLSSLIAQLEKGYTQDFSRVGRPLEGLSFAGARGTLTLPVRGNVVGRFNETDKMGRVSRGLTIETLSDAQVTSMFEGTIIYAGPFRDYGQLLIISHGEGYHSLLAGMESVNAAVAQWVLAGEPVGQMGMQAGLPVAAGASGSAKPRLYLEIRHGGRSINPQPWLAAP